jgi:[ribosomal protein S5]-alanine N-acetyltransferase
MDRSPPRTLTLATARLVLYPSGQTEAARAFEIQSNWNVTRMLRMASWPPDRQAIDAWFAEHAGEWIAGRAYRFAIGLQGSMIGLVDVDGISDGSGELGYWIDEPFWGRGYAFEAASALVRFAFEEVGLERLLSGHAEDNPASGKILRRLGFEHVRDIQLHSRSRRTPITQRQYALPAPHVSS